MLPHHGRACSVELRSKFALEETRAVQKWENKKTGCISLHTQINTQINPTGVTCLKFLHLLGIYNDPKHRINLQAAPFFGANSACCLPGFTFIPSPPSSSPISHSPSQFPFSMLTPSPSSLLPSRSSFVFLSSLFTSLSYSAAVVLMF